MVAVASPILLPVIHASWVAVAIATRSVIWFSGWQGDMRKVYTYTLEDERLEPTAITNLEIKIIFQTSMDYVPCESSWVYPKWMILDDMIYWLWGNEVMDILIMKNVTFVGIARVFEGFAGEICTI